MWKNELVIIVTESELIYWDYPSWDETAFLAFNLKASANKNYFMDTFSAQITYNFNVFTRESEYYWVIICIRVCVIFIDRYMMLYRIIQMVSTYSMDHTVWVTKIWSIYSLADVKCLSFYDTNPNPNLSVMWSISFLYPI